MASFFHLAVSFLFACSVIKGYDLSECTVSNPSWIEDGMCDGVVYNTLECFWDGGDCCTATNAGLSSNDECLDPLYSSATATTSTTDVCEFILDNVSGFDFSQIGNGICETADGAKYYSYYLNGVGGSTTINDATCDWDGGDCCTATNMALSNDENCMNPLYATTPTPTEDTTTTTTDTVSSSYTGCVGRVEIDDLCEHDGYYAKIKLNGDLVMTVRGESCNYAAGEHCEVLAVGDTIAITGYYDNDVEICEATDTVPELSVGSVEYWFYCTDGDGYQHTMQIFMDIAYSTTGHAKAKKMAFVAFVVTIVAILTQ